MNNLNVRRLTAVFGLAIVALNWAMFPLYIVPGQAPQFQDTARFIDYWTRINGIVLTRVFLDIILCACLLVFAAGLRHLIRQARSDYEWVGTLAFGSLLICYTFSKPFHQGLAGQALLDTHCRGKTCLSTRLDR